jgi:hypothetical protein
MAPLATSPAIQAVPYGNPARLAGALIPLCPVEDQPVVKSREVLYDDHQLQRLSLIASE